MGRVAWVTLLLAALAGSVFAQETPERRKYKDRTAPEWARDLLTGDVPARQRAIYAIFQLAMWEKGLGPVIVRALSDDDEYVRKTAAAIFSRLGQSGAGAIPHLFDLLRSEDPALRKEAILALFQVRWLVGKDVGPVIRMLDDPDPIVRSNAAAVIEGVGAAARERATEPLLRCMADEDPSVAMWAARALAMVNPPALVEPLIPRIREGTAEERARAIGQIGYARQAAAAAIPDLIASLDDGSPKVREAAAKALGVVAAINEKSIDALAGLLADPDAAVRRAVVEALGYSGARAKTHAAAVASLFRDDDIEVRRATMIALMSLGPDAAPETVLAALDDPDPTIRSAALSCLGMLRSGSAAVVPKLRELLRGEDPVLRAAAAQGLGGIGEAAAAAAPDLIAALGDEVADVRVSAARALGTTGRGSPEAVNALIGALRDPDRNVRYFAIQTLGTFREEAAAARGALMKFLTEEPMFAVVAARALGQMGEVARPTLPGLRRALSHSDSNVKLSAGLAIWRIDPGSAEEVTNRFRSYIARADIRNAALTRAREIPELVKRLLPEILVAMRKDQTFFAAFAASTVIEYGTDEQIGEAALILIGVLERDNVQFGLVQSVIFQFGALGAAARPAIPALRKIERGGDDNLQRLAADALKKIRVDVKKPESER